MVALQRLSGIDWGRVGWQSLRALWAGAVAHERGEGKRCVQHCTSCRYPLAASRVIELPRVRAIVVEVHFGRTNREGLWVTGHVRSITKNEAKRTAL